MSRSPSASGLAQRERPRGPRWWPRPPRSRHQAVLTRSRSESSQPGAGAEVEAWAGSEVPGPPGPLHSRPRVIRLRGSRQLQSQITQFQMQIQMQRSQSRLRGRVHRGHRLYDVLAALSRRPQQQSLHQRPSVAPGPGCKVVTNHRCLAGQQQQQHVEPRP